MAEVRTPGLRSANVRRLLTKDLEGLPSDMAQQDDTYMMAIIAAIWLDTDDRLAASGQPSIPALRHDG